MSKIKDLYWSYLAGLSVTAALELFHAAEILGIYCIGMTDRQIQSHIFHQCSDDQVRKILNSTDSPLNLRNDPYWSHRFFFGYFSTGFEPFHPMNAAEARACQLQTAA